MKQKVNRRYNYSNNFLLESVIKKENCFEYTLIAMNVTTKDIIHV